MDSPIGVRWRLLGQSVPHLKDASPLSREHAVLETVETFAVDWWDEAAGSKVEENAWREVVFADTVSKLEILIEHGPEG